MMYHEALPEDYFGDLYTKVSTSLTKGENTCVSVIQGCGARTLYNFLETLIRKHQLFSDILTFCPELSDSDITVEVRNKILTTKGTLLVIISSFEYLKNRTETLFKLDALRRSNYKNVVYLAITDHTAITEKETYTTAKSIFFSEVLFVPPFNLEQTRQMVDTLVSFYGWEVPQKYYRAIYELSGGIPRLIKYICKECSEARLDIDNTQNLNHIQQVVFQLRILANMLIRLHPDDLEYLGLVENGKIKSLLLRRYFKDYISDQVREIFPYLSASEAKILSYLLENKQKIVSIDKLANIMNMADEDFSLWAIYKKISRLKTRVKNFFMITNTKGVGYSLTLIA